MSAVNASLYTDFSGLAELKAKASDSPDESLEQVAQQFESLLMQQMLKSMRQASLGDSMMDNDQSLFYRDMFDQQLALHLSESGGIGLADVIKRQLGGGENDAVQVRSLDDYRNMAIAMANVVDAPKKVQLVDKTAPEVGESRAPVATIGESEGVSASLKENFVPDSPKEFIQKLWPWASEAASLLGLEPQALLAQAALESGWGKHVMKFTDGNSANNLFGIKADRRWEGDKVTVPTLEYEEGVAVRKKAHFRAYDSYRDSFLDYVNFLKADRRYDKAIQSAEDPALYFKELQRAGYATDPNYARKISSVLAGKEMQQALEELKANEPRPL